MAEYSRFFPSIASDRLYTASQVDEYLYETLEEENGVLHLPTGSAYDGMLAVTNAGTLSVDIDTGCAVKSGVLYLNSASLNKALSSVTSGSLRIDRIVIRTSVANRNMVATIITGTETTGTPAAPAIVDATDILLAKILVDRTTGTYVYTVTDERDYRPYVFVSSAALVAAIHAAAAKTTLADADELPLADSGDSFNLKHITAAYIWAWIQSKINGATNKDALVDADKIAIIDTEASNVVKTTTWANIKAKIKTALGITYTSGTLTVDGSANTVNIPTTAEKAHLAAIEAAAGTGTAAKITALIPLASPTVAGTVMTAADGGTTAGTAVQGNDYRLENDMTVVPNPTGFLWTAHPLVGKIYSDRRGRFAVKGFDITALIPALVQEGYVSATGSNGNSGLDADHPMASVIALLNTYPNINRVHIAGGFYPYTGFSGTIGSKNTMALIGAPDGTTVMSTAMAAQTFTLATAQTYTFQATIAAASVSKVIDISTKQGPGAYDYYAYAKKTSIADVEATAGSWFLDGTTLYVHALTGLSPDNANVKLLQPNVMLNFNGPHNSTIYMQDIAFLGGQLGSVRATGASTGYLINVYALRVFGGFSDVNGWTIENATSIFQNCSTAFNSGDGFNYHGKEGATGLCYSIEIGCHAYYNGNGDHIDNGSSTHDSNHIIRINGQYHHNYGPNVIDVTSGTESWNLGCTAYACADATPIDFEFGIGPVNAWLDWCSSYSSTTSLIVGTGSEATVVHKRHFDAEGTVITTAPATLVTY